MQRKKREPLVKYRLKLILSLEVTAENIVCGICGNLIYKNQKMTIDHIIPHKLGGTNETTNIQYTHQICNCIKSDYHPDDFEKNKQELFEFALQNWKLKRQEKEIIITALKNMKQKKLKS